MIEAVKEKTNEDKLAALKQDVGKAFFDYGRLKYEIEVKEKELGNISVNLHNLNHKCIDLTAAIEKEAKAVAMDLKLATPAPTPPPEPTAALPEDSR